jgi:hypothetical protein
MAGAIAILCHRRIGEQIIGMKEEGIIRRGKLNNVDIDYDDIDNRTVVKLADLGITRDESSKYQAMAAIPEPVFDESFSISGEEHLERTTGFKTNSNEASSQSTQLTMSQVESTETIPANNYSPMVPEETLLTTQLVHSTVPNSDSTATVVIISHLP